MLGQMEAAEAGSVGLAQQRDPVLVEIGERLAGGARDVVEDAELDRGTLPARVGATPGRPMTLARS
jgi:hypothetical protein